MKNVNKTTNLLLACGIIAPILFVTTFLIDGATRVGYDPFYHSVSSLSLSERGWVQIANFVISGLLLVGFALGVRRKLKSGPASVWGPILLAIFGISLVFSGVFVMDPMQGYPIGAPAGVFSEGVSWHHTLHDIFGIVVFASLPIAAFVFARKFFKQTGNKKWFLYSLATGIVMLVLFLTYGTSWEADAEYAGLIQRAMLMTGFAWITLLAIRLRKNK